MRKLKKGLSLALMTLRTRYFAQAVINVLLQTYSDVFGRIYKFIFFPENDESIAKTAI